MKSKVLVCFLLVATLNACRSAPKPETSVVRDGEVTVSMQQLKMEMDQLLPKLASPRQFNASENQVALTKELEVLSQTARQVSHAPAMQTKDPTLSSLSKGFQDEIGRSLEAFKQGKKEYARGNLLNVTAYCMECHTRVSAGPAFQSVEAENVLKTLSPLDRGEYLLATRRYEPALKEFTNVIAQGVGPGVTAFDLDRASRLALMITVRFQNNIKESEKVVDSVLKSKSAPFYLTTAAKSWNQGLTEWKKEGKRALKKDPIQFCQDLIAKGRAKQEGADERSGDIEMMRAQALLHPVLMTLKDPKKEAQALYLLGQAFESVRDLALWNLHEDYYESCIRKLPHSDWSSRCYQDLRKSVLLGYTGSSGTSIPTDVEKKLSELKSLAL